MLGKGNKKIQHMLDLRSIIKQFRAVKTLQKLLIPKQARRLIGMQRSARVIDSGGHDSYSDKDSGKSIKLAKEVKEVKYL